RGWAPGVPPRLLPGVWISPASSPRLCQLRAPVFVARNSFGERSPSMSVISSGWALDQVIAQVTVDVLPADILNAVSTPVVVVPAPGKGRAAFLLAVTASLRFGTTPYVNPGGSADPNLLFGYLGPSGFSAIAMPNFSLYQLLVLSAANAVSFWSGSSGNFPRP